MAAACKLSWKHVFWITVFVCFILLVMTEDNVIQSRGRSCPYFGEARYSTMPEGLVNCSWYGQDACCKRTEVTSVFSNMDPLYMASSMCKNHMNYLMCYFCSPEQHVWIKDKVRVCSEFCETVYFHCMEASFNGSTIGSKYDDGKSFCEAQNFEVLDGKSHCFKFDPTVFASANQIMSSILCFLTVLSTFSLYIINVS